MVLHAPGHLFGARDSLDGAVVEVAVCQLDAVRERVLTYGEAVVLARYLDASSFEVPDGMVRAVVAEGHLVRLATEGEPEELVSEADSEGWNLSEEEPQGVDGLAERGGVARAVGEEETVGFCREDLP